MSNVLDNDKHQQVLALGRLGWSLRRIEEATGVRRETAGAYLKGGRDPVARARWPPKGVAAKTGHHDRGVHRRRLSKTGHHADA